LIQEVNPIIAMSNSAVEYENLFRIS
jgi:hypothetical protein